MQVLNSLPSNAARRFPGSSPIRVAAVRDGPRVAVPLDPMPPGADGIEPMENVPEPADLPVVFICARGRDVTVARAPEHCAADHLVKPFPATSPSTARSGGSPGGGRAVRLTATEFEPLARSRRTRAGSRPTNGSPVGS